MARPEKVAVVDEIRAKLADADAALFTEYRGLTVRGLAELRGTLRATGTEYKVTTERPSLSLSVTELDAGSWVMFELPGFTTAASGTEQSSLDALRKASATSYYKGNGSLWVKLVSTGDVLGSGPDSGPSGGASLQASR